MKENWDSKGYSHYWIHQCLKIFFIVSPSVLIYFIINTHIKLQLSVCPHTERDRQVDRQTSGVTCCVSSCWVSLQLQLLWWILLSRAFYSSTRCVRVRLQTPRTRSHCSQLQPSYSPVCSQSVPSMASSLLQAVEISASQFLDIFHHYDNDGKPAAALLSDDLTWWAHVMTQLVFDVRWKLWCWCFLFFQETASLKEKSCRISSESWEKLDSRQDWWVHLFTCSPVQSDFMSWITSS